ncbi:ABC transporter ATP-binding protein [Bellilinea sp.]|uniref:ABC transporter ATP-binding protein n=1 Tax=Bellilinea sp. TaxID=2838785 RepID=UPI002ADD9FBC|nr:ABC transporter ATP-binding protein [Bellilinea sp.]
MGFFAGLDAEKYDRKYSDRELIRRILNYFRPHFARLFVVGFLVLIVSGAGALMPILVSRGIDYLKDELTPINVLFIPFAVMLTGVIAWLANWQARRLIVRSVADVVARLANEAFASAAEHDLSFYDQFSTGKIASRITSDTQDFGQLVVLTTDLISQVVESLILAIVLVNLEWRLALTLFAIIPIVGVLAMSFRGLARKVTRAGMRAMANVNQTIKETVSGIAVAKNFRQEGRIFELFDQSNRLSYQVNVRRGLVLSMVFPVLNTVGGWMTALLVYVGGISAVQGAVTVGAWYLFLLSLDRFMFPVMNLSSFWTQIQNGLSAAERVFGLIDADPSVVQTGDVKAPRLRGQIDFNHVYFRYTDASPVLEDFNLHISPGESVALVGHTGAGKSSVVKLIARFYEFQGGEILIDGMDIRSFDLGSYRCQLGIVSQVPFLFSGTLLENIQYSCKGASEEEIERLAYQIGNGEWLEALPDGLMTQVGERGGRLSMGQRQLVSLMRVLVQKPAIFVLDEATASIDPFTERQIQQALEMVLSQSTSILIAHRLSTVKAADRIIVLDHGKIIEEGNHEELMNTGGHYADLYNTYFRHQSLSYIDQAGKMREEVTTKIGRLR